MVSKFLDLFFNEGETICVSCDEYGYKSVDIDDVKKGSVVLESPSEWVDIKPISTEDIALMALNPINGFRNDKNVTAYRSFLVALDEGEL